MCHSTELQLLLIFIHFLGLTQENHTEHSPEMRIHDVNQPRITNNDLQPVQGAMSTVGSHGQPPFHQVSQNPFANIRKKL